MSSQSQPSKLDRQGFVKIVTTFLGSIMGAILGLPLINYFITPALQKEQIEDWVAVGPLEDYPIGKPQTFTFTRTQINGWERTSQSYGVYVLRQNQADLSVLSNVCTHLSCRVTWKEEQDAYICPCHDASFDIQGEVIKGPPPRPLDQFETKIEEGIIYIHLLEG
ncbi:MAG: Rieske (2Fe-2S) protein [Anaerolineales bacterium]|nr:Rieske (2Fe-2S) protein [Anaerolineales bacterium]